MHSSLYLSLVVGIICMIIAIIGLILRQPKYPYKYKVKATISGNASVNSYNLNDTSHWYAAIYAWEHNGKQYHGNSKVHSAAPVAVVGKKKTLYIDPDNPSDFKEKTIWGLILALIFMGVGLYNVFGAVLGLWMCNIAGYMY